MDCMEYMRSIPDKFFELAIVDPPYGLDKKVPMEEVNLKQVSKQGKYPAMGHPSYKGIL